MKNNAWLKNLVYLLLIVVLYLIGSSLLSEVKEQVYRRFDYNFYTLTLFTLKNLLFFGGIGVVLGIDGFINQFKKTGKWRFNLPKLLVLGLPSLIMSVPIISALLLIQLITSINLPALGVFTGSEYIVFSIIFGHTLISSLYKE